MGLRPELQGGCDSGDGIVRRLAFFMKVGEVADMREVLEEGLVFLDFIVDYCGCGSEWGLGRRCEGGVGGTGRDG